MTLGQMREAMTPEELILWHAFITIQNEEQQKAMDKAKRGRR